MIMLMVAAVVCFVAISLAVSVVSIVSVLLKRIVMVCWMDIVAYNHPVKSITRKGLSADLSFLSAGLRFFSYQNEDQSRNMQCQGDLDDWKAKHVLAVMDCASLS